jgi:hypothetical protein
MHFVRSLLDWSGSFEIISAQWLQWLQWGVTFSQVVWLIGSIISD